MNNTDFMKVFALALMAASSGKNSIPKAVVDRHIDDRLTRGKTRKGAKHIHGKVFKSINMLKGVTPAMYRHGHARAMEKGNPNYGRQLYY